MSGEKTTSIASSAKSIKDLSIGGNTMPCTREEFDKQIEGKVRAKCPLKDVGTFYFVYGEADPMDTRGWYRIYIKFYNDEENVVHTSSFSPVISTGGCYHTGVAIDQNTFTFDNCLVTLTKTWSSCNYAKLSDQSKSALIGHLSKQTTVHKDGLSRIREVADSDFTLESDDGSTVSVHKSVLEGLWPFFKGMVDSKMEETTNKRVKLNMPKSTMDVLVRYLYGEDLNLQFDDAANLIVYAQMYDLPELLDLATEKVKQMTLSIQQAIYLWRKAFEAKNESVRAYSANKIEGLIPETKNFNAQIESLEKIELLSLFSDAAAAMAK